jgi:hypothetical protein
MALKDRAFSKKRSPLAEELFVKKKSPVHENFSLWLLCV